MKTTSIFILILVSLFIFSNASASTYTWTGIADTVFTNSSNWSSMNGSTYPGVNDTAIIVSATNRPVLASNYEVYRLVVTSGSFDLKSYVFTATGSGLFSAGTVSNGTLVIRGTSGTFTGGIIEAALDVNCDNITLNGSVFNGTVLFTSTGMENCISEGGNEFNAAATFVHTGNRGTGFRMGTVNGDVFNEVVSFTNSSNGILVVAEADTSWFNGNVKLNNNGTHVIYFGYYGGVSELASGKTISVGSTGYAMNELILFNFKQNGSTAQNLTLTGTAMLTMKGCEFNGATTLSAPELLCSHSVFNGTTQITKTGTGINYWFGSNTFNGITTIHNQGTTDNDDDLRLADDQPNVYNHEVNFQSTGKPIQVVWNGDSDFYGDVSINHEAIDFNSGEAFFKGSEMQILSGDTTINFSYVTIDKTAQGVTLQTPSTVSRTLTFTDGHFYTDTTHVLTFLAGSDATGAHNGSFVSGPVMKVGDSAFEFPVGKDAFYSPVVISAPTLSSDAFTAEYFDSGQHSGENFDATLAYLDDCNHWKILRKSGSSNIYLTLNWNINHCPIPDTTYLRIVSWFDNNWNDLDHGIISGNYSSGNMTSLSTILNYGYFTFAFDTNIFNMMTPDAYIKSGGFVENIGQLMASDSSYNTNVQFYGNSGNATLFLSDSVFSYVISTASKDTIEITPADTILRNKTDSLFRIDMKFSNFKEGIQISKTDTSQGYKNYFYGDSVYTHALTYQKITYENIYDNIDLSFVSGGELFFEINEYGNPDSIEFYFRGLDSITIDSNNIMNLYTPAGYKQFSVLGYESNEGLWNSIDVDFLKTDSLIKFSLGSHTANVPLLIKLLPPPNSAVPLNPSNLMKWSTYFFGGFYEGFTDVFLDKEDNIYMIGSSESYVFPVTNGGTYIGSLDVTIAKFDSERNLAFAIYYGGQDADEGFSISVDNNKNIYCVGFTSTVDGVAIPFPVCLSQLCGYSQPIYGGGQSDGFIVVLNPNGTAALMSTYFGGYGSDVIRRISLHPSGEFTIAGDLEDPNQLMPNIPFPNTNPGYHETNSGGFSEGFVATFNSNYTLEWSTHLGGLGEEMITDIIYDDIGYYYVLGYTQSVCDVSDATQGCSYQNAISGEFPLVYDTGNEHLDDNTSFGDQDLFICKFDADSRTLCWSTMIGDAGTEFFNLIQGRSILYSPQTDEIYIVGGTSSSTLQNQVVNLGTSNINDNSLNGQTDNFIVRFNDEFEIDWLTYFGGNGLEHSGCISMNELNDIYIGTTTNSDNLPSYLPNTGAYQQSYGGLFDGYILSLSTTGIANYGQYLGGDQPEGISAIAHQRSSITNQSDLIVIGHSSSGSNDIVPFPLKNYLMSTKDYNQQNNSPAASANFYTFITNLHNVAPWMRNGIFSELNEVNNSTITLNIYPNPTGGLIYINSGKFEIQKINIYNVSGQKLMGDIISNKNHCTINLSSYPPGLYFAELFVQGEIHRRKIILVN